MKKQRLTVRRADRTAIGPGAIRLLSGHGPPDWRATPTVPPKPIDTSTRGHAAGH